MGIKVYANCRIGNDFLLIASTGLQHREQARLAEVQSLQLRDTRGEEVDDNAPQSHDR